MARKKYKNQQEIAKTYKKCNDYAVQALEQVCLSAIFDDDYFWL